MTRRLNLGCGGQIVSGWVNVDRSMLFRDGDGDHFVVDGTLGIELDLGTEPWPWESDSIAYAVCHHVLDLLTIPELDHFLAECLRVLQPGGFLRISNADLQGAIDDVNINRFSRFDGLRDAIPDTTGDLLADYMFLGGARKTFLTRPRLVARLIVAGFTPYIVDHHHTLCPDVQICDLDSREAESYWVEGVAK